jgi:short-subunit dehydrogenase
MKVIITGASRGIGRAIAEEMCKDGHDVLALARSEDKLKELVESCEGLKGSIHILSGDLTKVEFVDNVVKEVGSLWGGCDILINNAGRLVNESFDKISMDVVREMYEVNVFATMNLTRGLVEYMDSGGHVVTIGSMGGFPGSIKFPGLEWYSSTKAVLANLTECLAEAYKERGVSFNCLALGAVQTEMLFAAFPSYEAPVGPKEMGRYIANFAINGGKLFNGKVLPVSVTTP